MNTGAAIKEISPDEAKEKLNAKSAVFIDVRDPDSYRSAHIPGSVHLNDKNVQEWMSQQNKNQTVICYCYHGNSSLGAAAYLMQAGFSDVYSLVGGFERWRVQHPDSKEGSC